MGLQGVSGWWITKCGNSRLQSLLVAGLQNMAKWIAKCVRDYKVWRGWFKSASGITKCGETTKWVYSNVLTEGWVHVAFFMMQTILFKNVDVSEYMDPALLMMWFMPVARTDKVRRAPEFDRLLVKSSFFVVSHLQLTVKYLFYTSNAIYIFRMHCHWY